MRKAREGIAGTRETRKMKNKYKAKKTLFNGRMYDSKKEAQRAAELQLMEKAGVITNLQEQVPFELIPSQYEYYERYGKKGKRLKDGRRCLERSVDYVADFVYMENDKVVVEDAKSPPTRTKEYVIKRKLMLERLGIRVKEV